ncbi:unnamed protein product [Phytomonas sp. EM1]|nr:unnamed protein product [Phytomonas sp. EM1]|eukprot:CCW64443.1 unnamed protein product [Phytomonas sp. isolate EM1]
MKEQVGAEPAMVRLLWERYCGALQGSSSNGGPPTLLDYTDPVVDEIWQLFFPILNDVKLIPVGSLAPSALPAPFTTPYPREPTSHDNGDGTNGDDAIEGPEEAFPENEEDLDADPDVLPATCVFYLALKGPSPEDVLGEAVGGPSAAVLSREMASLLCQQPHIVLPLLEFFVALRESRRGSPSRSLDGETPSARPRMRVSCGVLGDPTQLLPFDQLGAAQLGRLLTLKGTVVRMSPPRLSCLRMTYRCGLCEAIQTLATEDGLLVYPGPCHGRGQRRCRGYKWTPLPDHAVCEEVQFLKLQEHTDFFDGQRAAGAGKESSGGAYKVVEVELRHPLLDRVTVGETVWVCGVLHTYRGELRRAGASWGGGVQHLCLHARSIEAAKEVWWRTPSPSPAEGGGETGSWWSPDECARYYEMARHPRWFARLTASVAPSLYGLRREKEAILLAIVGGSPTNKVGCRGGIHLLLLGDPGMGKSQLLRAACAIAPRSAFVCAHTSSTCGLTMTLVRDPVTGGATFEAGAVVHGDGGVTCIDEIDKTAAEHKALLEVMEQECVSIAKAGMVFSMPVHTSILAAGNPIGGRFDFSKPIMANVNLSRALLSRFDLVVCLQDRREGADAPAEEAGDWDTGLTHHVLNLHRHGKGDEGKETETENGERERRGGGANRGGPSGAPARAGGVAVLPHDLVRQFILFCRSQCQPTLSAAALAVLKAHYLAEREGGAGGSSTAGCRHREGLVTPRYLQALVRLAEARAKVELRTEVSREDAEYAVNLVQDCLRSFSAPGACSTAASETLSGLPGGRGKKSTQREVVINLLKEAIIRGGGVNRLSHNTILQACEEAGCRDGNAMLHQLNEFGVLLKCGDKYTLRGV